MRFIIQARGDNLGVTTIERTITAKGWREDPTPDEIREAVYSLANELLAVLAPIESPAPVSGIADQKDKDS
jgi:hypothetical protein